jgi:hypothetical protein
LLPNESVIVNGIGFSTGGGVTITLITIGGVPVPDQKINDGTTVQVDNAGNFDIRSLIIPINNTTLTTGSHTVTARDSRGRSASTTVSFQRRTLKVDPNTSRRGSRVTVTGTGFPASSTRAGADASPSVNIRYDIIDRGPRTLASALTNSFGEFSTSFTVPLDSPIPSTNRVTVQVAGHPGAETEIISHSVPNRSIKVSPESGPPGSSFTVTGSNFPGFAPMRSLTIGQVQVLPSPTPTTDGDGSFTATVSVPDLAAGTQVVEVGVGDSTALVSFRVTAPAPAPTPTRPAGVAPALAPLGSNLVRLWGYDAKKQAFQLYDPAAPVLSDLTVLVRGRGYWILVNRDQIITLGSSSYDLSAGWNLIGWLG